MRLNYQCVLTVCAGAVLAFLLGTGPASAVVATAALVQGDKDATVFKITLDKGVPAEVFTLGDPYRVVIDFPDIVFNLPPGTGAQGGGLISAFRFGSLAEHKARVVMDATGPVKVTSAGMTRAGAGGGVVLQVSLAPTDTQSFVATLGQPKAEPPASAPPIADTVPQKRRNQRPVIVVDPGHGGIDPGTSGAKNTLEKALVLAVGLKLQRALGATGRYDVKMTRVRDVFVSLDKRVAMSTEADADLFISIHADSISETAFAESVRGATIYTLSERASDEQARRMAEKENASDVLAGIEGLREDVKDNVKDILVDLLRRETANFSADFSRQLAAQLGKAIVMSKDPQRSAAFKVLKQPHAPSVLIELGYMSNSKDQAEMLTDAWQGKVADAVARSVESYFSKRTAVHP